MIQKMFSTVIALSITLIPFVTSAEYFGQVDSLVGRVSGFIDAILIPFIFTLALFIFLWGMFRFFIWGQANEEEHEKGRQLILWGIIGMAVMISIWGIVAIFAEGIFGATNVAPTLPGTPTL